MTLQIKSNSTVSNFTTRCARDSTEISVSVFPINKHVPAKLFKSYPCLQTSLTELHARTASPRCSTRGRLTKAYDLLLIWALLLLVTDFKIRYSCLPATKHVLRLVYLREKLCMHNTRTLQSAKNTVRPNVQLTQTKRDMADRTTCTVLRHALS